MHTSILLAKLIGLVYLTIGLGLVINPKYYHKMFQELIKDKGMMYISGLLALIAGFFLVNAHNIWISNWIVIITVFGWLALVKGIIILMFPSVIVKMSKSLFKTTNAFLIDGLIILILGIAFAYLGFFM